MVALNLFSRKTIFSLLAMVVLSSYVRPTRSIATGKIKNISKHPSKGTTMIFPGGGIFFYWQAGVVTYLREAGYDLSDVTFVGASAGALVATFTAADVDFEEATDLALSMCDDYGVWKRPLGLFGVWGKIVELWLDKLLHEDSLELATDRLCILLTSIPSFEKQKISFFHDKRDLIAANMASVHIPWFMNFSPCASFREKVFIDGSFFSTIEDYRDDTGTACITINWQDDPKMVSMSGDFAKAIGREKIWSTFEDGKEFAKCVEGTGKFQQLSKDVRYT
mmetsp:Transcript_8042/g.10302  ORF Transcript_8042/g.10302 Transcript_8042/m.10302 type:complete len:279 (-) Transcript_8042:87-923(-)